MNFKIKFFNSAHLDEVETRRFKIKLFNFNYFEFLSYLKGVYDVGEAETIFVFWKNNLKWTLLCSEECWNLFVKNNEHNSHESIKLNIYYGNVHISVTCDICGNTVIGDRYKCIECDDFDICQICFQRNYNIHKEHCVLLLRTSQDSLKYISAIPMSISNGIPDLGVIDINLMHILNGNILLTNVKETQTETLIERMESVNKKDNEMNMPLSVRNNSQVDTSRLTDCSSIPQDYLNLLPLHINNALNTLLEMGFTNINGPLIALLIEKNGNIIDVIEELEHNLKK